MQKRAQEDQLTRLQLEWVAEVHVGPPELKPVGIEVRCDALEGVARLHTVGALMHKDGEA